MKSRIFNTFVALLAIAGSVTAQTLSVVPVNADTDASSNIVVSIEGATAMTALQFNVKLPSNCTFAQSGSDNYGITLGSAAASHTMSVQPIDGGDIMVVLYDLYQHSFADGELLTIPVVAGSEAGTASGSLYTVRSSTVDYVSHSLGTASFTATVEQPAYSLAVTAAGYASLYLSSAVEIPLDVEVYTATAVEGDLLKMQQVTGILPANTGAIVKADAGTYSFIYSDENPAAIEGNLLLGTTTDTYIKPTAGTAAYVLSQVDGIVGMYLAELNGEGRFLNNANKAYMLLGEIKIEDGEIDTSAPGTQLSAGYRFDFGGTTGVEKVEMRKEKVEIYDLQGRKLNAENVKVKGIYIVNGKKYWLSE